MIGKLAVENDWTRGMGMSAHEPRADRGDAARWPATTSLSLRERLAHRLAMHLPVAPFRMRNAQPLVTFTFDDVPASAWTVGAPILEAHDANGTFYISAGCLGERTPDWTVIGLEGIAALAANGHEIGCHTFSHAQVTVLNESALQGEVRANEEHLRSIVPFLELRNFAYPFGLVTWASKLRLRGLFDSSRSIIPGVNHGLVDLQFLRAVPLHDGRITPDGLERLLDETVARNGWLVFYTHDVAARPSDFGCTPGLLARALDSSTRRGIASLTVASALHAVGHRSMRRGRQEPST